MRSKLIAFALCLLVCKVATAAPACPAGVPVAGFRLTVRESWGARPIPIQALNRLRAGNLVEYAPGDQKRRNDSEISLMVLPDSGQELYLLPSKNANERQQWTVPTDVAVLAVAYGPNGLNDGKMKSLLTKDQELIAQLAEYSERNTQAENLIEALSGGPLRESRTMEAAIQGFAQASGISQKLDRSSTLDQQSMTLMRALTPAIATYDPLTPEAPARWQQSAGLAAAVAGLFFGNTVGLAGSGAALFLSLHTMAFPKTEFRSALLRDTSEITQAISDQTLCARKERPSRARLAYIWARKLTKEGPPALSLSAPVHLAAGLPGNIPVHSAGSLERVQKWKLVNARGVVIPLKASWNAARKTLDVAPLPATIPIGDYDLFGEWDWTDLRAPGIVSVEKLSDLSELRIEPGSADALTAGASKVRILLEGDNLHFLEHVQLIRSGDALALPQTIRYVVAPDGKRAEMEVDTNGMRPGPQQLLVTQRNGAVGKVAIAVHEPPPQIASLPLQLHAGEAETVTLRGKGLDQIESIESPDASIELGNPKSDSEREVRIKAGAQAGTRADLRVRLAGRSLPIVLPSALEVVSPRARIVSVKPSDRADSSIELRDDELAAGQQASFALQLDHMPQNVKVTATCGGAQVENRFTRMTSDTLFLTVQPKIAGCVLEAGLLGNKEAVKLGRVIRLPRIEGFELTDEKSGDGFAGTLKGEALELIEKVGWSRESGTAVEALPSPDGQKQSLRVRLPWPSPAPHAPLFLWLRGEADGRATTVKY